MSQEPKELTEDEINKTVCIMHMNNKKELQAYRSGAKYAKKRSDAYWKARVVEEAEKLIEWLSNDYTPDTVTEYINQLKARL